MSGLPPFVDLDRALRDDVVLVDVRWYLDGRSGRAAYDAGHLPGAVRVDLDRVLAGPPSPQAGRHPLPEPRVFAAGLAEVGIAPDSTVVAYDDAGGVVAARLVWLLRALGVPAALLDGGLAAYDGPLETEPAVRARAEFPARPWPAELFADLAAATGPGVVLLDARDRERYRGDVEPVDVRAGHVPGARSLPARSHLDERGRLLPVPVLRERLAAGGVSPGAQVVSSCGSGVTACHTLLVLEHAGFGPGRLWPGSWSQYAATDLPAARGDAPGGRGDAPG